MPEGLWFGNIFTRGFFNPLECGLAYSGHTGNFIVSVGFKEN